jgi:hypothetical protein
MAVLTGKDGRVKIGATSDTAVGNVNSWTLNESADEYPGKHLGVDYTTRITGHTDWTAALDVDLDESDSELTDLLSVGAAATVYLYTDEDSAKGRTGAGVVLNFTKTVSGAAKNNVTINIGGNGALADIS